MSIPVMHYYCKNCGYDQKNDTIPRGRKEYLLPDGSTLPLSWNIGWCEDCGGIAAVEVLSREAHERKYREAIDILDQMPGRPERRWWQLHWHLFTGLWRDRIEQWEWRIKWNEKQAREAIALIELLDARSRPPRCLQCGSERIIAPVFVYPDNLEEPQWPQKTLIHHPTCGGEIWLRRGNYRFAPRFMLWRFTSEGDFVDESFDDT